MKKIIISFIITSTFFISLSAQVNNRDFIGDSLEQYIKHGMKTWNIPGMQVLVFYKGEAVFMKSFGIAENGSDRKVDNNTLFMIGSNTKAFTGTAMALIEYRKMWKLNDPVQKYLDDFEFVNAWLTQELNLTDILTHRMGMMTFQGDFMYWGSDLSRDECIRKFGQLEPVFDFRTRFGYTNAGYAVADKCIEVVTKKNWAQFTREEILAPLHMDASFLTSEELSTRENISAAHSEVNGEIVIIPRVHNDNIGAAASIWSNISEMINWVDMQLNDGVFEGKQVLPAQVIARTRQPQTIVGAYPHHFNKRNFMLYGLGWFLEDYESRLIVSHTGGVDGFVSSVTLLPDEKLGVVILTNTDQNSLFNTLSKEIVDAFLGLPFRNYDSIAYKRHSQNKKEEALRMQALKDSADSFKGEPNEELLGKYQHPIYGYVNLAKGERNSFVMTFEHHPQLLCILQPITENRFVADYQNPIYGKRIFQFVKEDRDWAFMLSVSDFLEYTTYKFVKIEP